MFIDDLIVLFTTKMTPPVVYGTTLFVSSKASLPSIKPAADGPFLTVVTTGGAAPEGTHNAVLRGLPGYQRPSAQIMARATSFAAADLMAANAYATVVKIGQVSQFINGVWWRSATVLQEPYDFGLDDAQRACVAFNILVVKRPNAAMSQ